MENQDEFLSLDDEQPVNQPSEQASEQPIEQPSKQPSKSETQGNNNLNDFEQAKSVYKQTQNAPHIKEVRSFAQKTTLNLTIMTCLIALFLIPFFIFLRKYFIIGMVSSAGLIILLSVIMVTKESKINSYGIRNFEIYKYCQEEFEKESDKLAIKDKPATVTEKKDLTDKEKLLALYDTLQTQKKEKTARLLMLCDLLLGIITLLFIFSMFLPCIKMTTVTEELEISQKSYNFLGIIFSTPNLELEEDASLPTSFIVVSIILAVVVCFAIYSLIGLKFKPLYQNYKNRASYVSNKTLSPLYAKEYGKKSALVLCFIKNAFEIVIMIALFLCSIKVNGKITKLYKEDITFGFAKKLSFNTIYLPIILFCAYVALFIYRMYKMYSLKTEEKGYLVYLNYYRVELRDFYD